MVKGFKKITGPNTKIVILGTFPSNISLEYGTYDKPTYYAGHGNNFWQLIGYSLDTNLIDLPFEKRYDILKNYGIGLWDVYDEVVKKPGKENSSKDRDIDKKKSKINPLNELVVSGNLKYICFNGDKAFKYSYYFDNHPVAIKKIVSSSNSCRRIITDNGCIKLTDNIKLQIWKTEINNMLKY